MYYPYSKEYICVALKELRGKKTQPILWNTLKLSDVKGKTGYKEKVKYSFKTKDGKEYELWVEGYYTRGYCNRKIFRPCAITAIKEKAS